MRKYLIFFASILFMGISCTNKKDGLASDADNGGLILPQGFSVFAHFLQLWL